VAKVSLKITNPKYSGIFGAKGASHGIIRVSAATKPDYTKPTAKAGGFIPGVAFKFFRAGQKSANFMAMRSLLPVSSYNPFKYAISNHVSLTDGAEPFAQKALGAKFSTASKWISHVGVSDAATFDEDGNRAGTIRSPFQLVFVPTAVAQNLAPDTFTQPLADMLAKVVPGTQLWTVMAVENPKGTWEQIGTITATSGFIESAYGDQHLFFQHQRFNDDLALNPQWLQVCPDVHACKVCPVDRDCATPDTSPVAVNKPWWKI